MKFDVYYRSDTKQKLNHVNDVELVEVLRLVQHEINENKTMKFKILQKG